MVNGGRMIGYDNSRVKAQSKQIHEKIATLQQNLKCRMSTTGDLNP